VFQVNGAAQKQSRPEQQQPKGTTAPEGARMVRMTKIQAVIEGKIIMHDVLEFGDKHGLGLKKTKELIRDIAQILQVPGWIDFKTKEDE